MNGSLPTLEYLKNQARRLRSDLVAAETPISHCRALELVAHQHGHRDWNTLVAALGNRRRADCPVSIGQSARGLYLGQAFEGEVIAVRKLGEGARFRVTFDFNEPVDVVTFDSFSSYRKRVSCVIDAAGITAEKTSNGKPHMQLAL